MAGTVWMGERGVESTATGAPRGARADFRRGSLILDSETFRGVGAPPCIFSELCFLGFGFRIILQPRLLTPSRRPPFEPHQHTGIEPCRTATYNLLKILKAINFFSLEKLFARGTFLIETTGHYFPYACNSAQDENDCCGLSPRAGWPITRIA